MKLRILKLAAPLFVSHIAVMLNGVIDTLMAGQLPPAHAAAIGLGTSAYFSVYIALMGVILALVPICAHHYGARQPDQIAIEIRQGFWLALLLSFPGCLLIAWSDLWFWMSDPPQEVADIARPYLWATAAGLPAALLFRVFHACSVAVGLPHLVMSLNVLMLALKAPLNALFMHGLSVGGFNLFEPMGAAGCAVASACLAWLSVLIALGLFARHPRLGEFGSRAQVPFRADRRRIGELLRLGLPIGAIQLVEVTSFTFMAILLARFGAVVGASHQIAASMAAMCYMLGLAIGTATSTLAAQSLGAAQPSQARAVAVSGLRLGLLGAACTALALWLFRTPTAQAFSADAQVIAMAVPLLALVSLFSFFDNAQILLTLVLRAWRITTAPMVVQISSLWGVGLVGGWWLSYGWAGGPEGMDHPLGGATGFWIAAAASLAVASAGLALLLRQVWRETA
jgi:MATE family multidrug resistance protein